MVMGGNRSLRRMTRKKSYRNPAASPRKSDAAASKI